MHVDLFVRKCRAVENQSLSSTNGTLIHKQASLCDAAIRQREQTGKGRFVNYNTLPESLWESIAPDHFGLQLSKTSIARMKDISGVYSKGRTDNSSKWVEDKDAEKKKLINEKQQAAARDILQPFYNEMEKYANET